MSDTHLHTHTVMFLNGHTACMYDGRVGGKYSNSHVVELAVNKAPHYIQKLLVSLVSPTCSRDLFLFRVHSALPQELSRFTFMSFGGDIKPSVPENPLKLAKVLLGVSLLTG